MVIQTNEHRRLVTPVKCNLNSRQRKDHITLSPHHHYNDQKSLPKRVLRTETVMLLSCSQTCFTNVVKMMGTTMWGFGLNEDGSDECVRALTALEGGDCSRGADPDGKQPNYCVGVWTSFRWVSETNYCVGVWSSFRWVSEPNYCVGVWTSFRWVSEPNYCVGVWTSFRWVSEGKAVLSQSHDYTLKCQSPIWLEIR